MSKRILPCLVLSCTIFSVAFSQDTTKDYHRPHFGLKGGVNASWFGKSVYPFDESSPDYAKSPYAGGFGSFLVGYHVGLTVDIRVNKSLSFAGELLFNGRGGEKMIKNDNVVLLDTAGNQTDAYDTYDYVIYYMELPLILQYHLHIKDNGNISSRVYFGLSPGIAMIHQVNYQYYTTDPSSGDATTNQQTQTLNNVRGFMLSPIIGLWVGEKRTEVPVKLFGDLRFEYAALSVFNKASIKGENLETHMSTLNLGFGIRF